MEMQSLNAVNLLALNFFYCFIDHFIVIILSVND